jgi:glutathione S-transferase
MTLEFVSVAEARQRRGLRMVVVGQVPSPWGEAAKGFFHLKRLPFVAVRLVYDDDTLKQWAGQLTAPVVFFDDEIPRSGWAEILMLAERLAPQPALLPLEPLERSRALAIADRICSPGGLAWTRRLQNVHAGLHKSGGFPERIAGYLGRKYGYDPAQAAGYGPRVCELLNELATALRAQKSVGKDYFLGDTLTAADVYSATCMAIFKPLPQAICAMDPAIRAAFEHLDEATAAALDPILIEHRDMMYARHLETPLTL